MLAPTFNDTDALLLGLTEENLLPAPLPEHLQLVIQIAYICLIFLAVVGNTLVILSILASRHSRNTTNLFLVSLATSDLLIALVNMPLQLLGHLRNEWTLGQTACKISAYLQGITIVVSVFTLVAIAADRYRAICQPLRHRRAHPVYRRLLLVACTWLLACLLLIPQIFIQRLEPVIELKLELSDIHNGLPKAEGESSDFLNTESQVRLAYVCREHFPDPRLNQAYTACFYVLLYLLPITCMMVAYGRIAHLLWFQKTIGEPSVPDRQRRLAEKGKVVRLLAVLMGLFAVSWFPFFTYQMLAVFAGVGQYGPSLGQALAQLVGYTNCCSNPLVYCLLSERFKAWMTRLCGRMGSSCKKRQYTLDTVSGASGNTSSTNPL